MQQPCAWAAARRSFEGYGPQVFHISSKAVVKRKLCRVHREAEVDELWASEVLADVDDAYSRDFSSSAAAAARGRGGE
eukprot:5812840-Pleurochrysis_carterae.AAC.1